MKKRIVCALLTIVLMLGLLVGGAVFAASEEDADLALALNGYQRGAFGGMTAEILSGVEGAQVSGIYVTYTREGAFTNPIEDQILEQVKAKTDYWLAVSVHFEESVDTENFTATLDVRGAEDLAPAVYEGMDPHYDPAKAAANYYILVFALPRLIDPADIIEFNLSSYYRVDEDMDSAAEYLVNNVPTTIHAYGAGLYATLDDAIWKTNPLSGSFVAGEDYYISFLISDNRAAYDIANMTRGHVAVDVPGTEVAYFHNSGTSVQIVLALPKLPAQIWLNEAAAFVGGASVTEAVPGEMVTIRPATDDSYKRFSYWEIYGLDTTGLDLTDESLTFTMPAEDITVTAYYVDLYDIYLDGATAYLNGVEVDKAAEGDEITIVLTEPAPSELHYFTYWETNGTIDLGAQATSTEVTLFMPFGNLEMRAQYGEKQLVEVSPYIYDGRVTVYVDGVELSDGYGYAKPGTDITVVAKPNAGYKLKEWTGGTEFTDIVFSKGAEEDLTIELTMPDTGLYIGAEFEIAYHDLIIDNADVDVNGSSYEVTAKMGDIVTVTVHEAPIGKRFSHWEFYGIELTKEQETRAELVFQMPDCPVELTAVYVFVDLDITVENATVTVNGFAANIADERADVVITANDAPDGAIFEKWVVTGLFLTEDQLTDPTISFQMPANEISVVAVYHTHTYSEAWSTNGTFHWHQCTDSDCPNVEHSKKDLGEHNPAVDDHNCATATTCMVCEYVTTEAKTHDFSGDFHSDKDGHWFVCQNAGCEVADTNKKSHTTNAYDYDCETAELCIHCDYPVVAAITHDFSGEWHKDGMVHWHVCENAGCTQIDAKVAHKGGSASCGTQAICEDCGMPYGNYDKDVHEGALKWIQSATTHQQIYSICNHVNVASEAHEWEDGVCTECAYVCTHTPAADDNNCATPILCTICGEITTAGKTHDFSGSWISDGTHHWHDCLNVNCGVIDEKVLHIPDADDGNCTSAIQCSVCRVVTTEGQSHDFSGEWVSDGSYHWHICEHAGCIQIDEKLAHNGGSASCGTPANCADCGKAYGDYDEDVHEGALKWIQTATTHQQIYSICGHVKVATEAHEWEDGACTECAYVCTHAPAADDNNCATPISCTICGEITTAGKTHDFSDAWTSDGEHHWHACENDGCNAIEDKDAHSPAEDDGNCVTAIYCTVCRTVTTEGIEHDFAEEWSSNDTWHWHDCTNSGCTRTEGDAYHIKGEAATEDTPQTCTACGYVLKEALGHLHRLHLTYVEGTDPTCTKDGNKGYYVCSCSAYFTTEEANVSIADLDAWKTGAGKIDKIPHAYTEQVKDADHLKEAADNCRECDIYWYDCADCDANAKNDPLAADKYYTSADAGDHAFTKKTETAEYLKAEGETCLDNHVYYFACAHCDVSAEGLTDATYAGTACGEHSFTKKIETEDYLREESVSCLNRHIYYFACEHCDISAKDITNIHYAGEARGAHSFGAWVSDGHTHTRTCINDSTHTESADCAGGKAATCTTRSVCDVCDNYYGEKDPANHAEDTPVWVRTATTHAKKYSCCNTFEVEAEAHAWEDGVCTECELPCTHFPGTDDDDCTTPIICTECGEITTAGITHDFSGEWVTDGEHHWHVCQNDGCDEIGDKDEHRGGIAGCNSAAFCATCNKQYGSVNSNNHQAPVAWQKTEHTHEKAYYGCCGKVEVAEAPHVYDDALDAVCDTCGYTRALSFTVTFDGNGAEGTMSPVSVGAGSYTIPECGFTAPAGKRFGGWKVGSNSVSGSSYDITESITLVAYWETEITSIVIEGFFLPQLGQNVAEYYASLFAKFQDGTIKVNGTVMDANEDYLFGNLYWENMVLWNLITDEQVGESLVAGKYLVDFCFAAADGYYFADDLTITVLDKANLFADLMDNEHDCEFSFTQNYGIPEIDRIEISGLPTPILGETAEDYYEFCMNALENYVKINGLYMDEDSGLFGNLYVPSVIPVGSDEVELDSDFVFVEGKYYLVVVLGAVDGYGFADDLVVTANGKTAKLYQYYEFIFALIEYEVEATVDSIVVEGIPTPVIGTTVESYFEWFEYLFADHQLTINGAPYYVGTISIEQVLLVNADTNITLDYDDIITAGNYYVEFLLSVPTGYTFANTITVTFNGANATVVTVPDGIYAYTEMTAAQPTVIDSVAIEGVLIPEIDTTLGSYFDAMYELIANGSVTINGQKHTLFGQYGVIWSGDAMLLDKDGNAIYDDDFVFASGKHYYADELYTDYGYIFADDVTVTVNGQPVTNIQKNGDELQISIPLYAKSSEAPDSVSVTLNGTNVTISGAANMIVGMDYTAVLLPATDYLLPAQILVVSGDYTMVAGEDYLYDQATGTLMIRYDSIEGPVTITVVAAHDHTGDLTPVAETPASCTTDGNKAYYTCSCGVHFADAEATVVIEDLAAWKTGAGKIAAGHSFGAWQIEIPATVDATGTKAHKDCTICHKHFDANDNEIAAADLVIPMLTPAPGTSEPAPGTSEPAPGTSEPAPDPITPPSGDGEGLSGGAITGIVIGSTATAGIGGFAIFWFVIEKKSWAQLLAIFKKKV